MWPPPFKRKLPAITESEQTPLVRRLRHRIAEPPEPIQRLADEIRRLKGGPPRPQLKPNPLEPAGQSGAEDPAAAAGDAPRRRGPRRAKTAELPIHPTEGVTLAGVPAGSEFTG